MILIQSMFLALCLLLTPLTALAGNGEKIQGVRAFLQNGNPEQAIRTAHLLLRDLQLEPSERMALMQLVYEAELFRARHNHYSDIQPALAATEAMLHEFPDHPQAPEFRWQRASLLWHAGKLKKASAALRELLTQDQGPLEQRRAWLLLARIHLDQGHLGQARSDLLQYGIHVASGSREQALGLAWMAMVDWQEQRFEAAFDSLKSLMQTHADIVTSEPRFYSTYVLLLHRFGFEDLARKHAERFLNSYLTSEYAPRVRLLHADILAGGESPEDDIREAIKEYGLLANAQAETLIGRQAFMRRLMLELRNKTDRDTLLAAMASLKKLADANQLSIIEDEATLDLARLWSRLMRMEPEAGHDRPALLAYAHAAISRDSGIAEMARREGSELMRQRLSELIEAQAWLSAVRLWRAYPGLRPGPNEAWEIHFGIARAMRQVMLLDAADEMLAALYEKDRSTLRGQRIMNERIKLWRDRNDQDAIEKSMRWLNSHESTIYRPEILATVARIQLQQGRIQEARQTLSQVAAADLAPESRGDYWKTRAEIAEKQKRWLNAASAWKQYRESPGVDPKSALLRHAQALFQAEHYAEARKLFLEVDEAQRNSSWEYHVAICEMHTGETREAAERLSRLADASSQDAYASLARLVLADQMASRLLGERP